MPKYKNPLLEMLRASLTELLESHVRQSKIAVAKNRVLGMSVEGIRAMREGGTAKWQARLEVLNRSMKREVAGIVNYAYHSAKNKGIQG